MIYRRLWQDFWALVAAIAVGLAMFAWSVVGVLVTIAMLTALGAAVKTLVPIGAPASSRVGALLSGRPLPHPLTVAVTMVSVATFWRLSPALGLLLVMAVGLTSPDVLTRGHRRRGRWGPEGAVATPPGRDTTQERPLPLADLDDRQLCQLWRESFWDLRTPASPQALLGLVVLRQACLDELERRDAQGLRAWLASGGRASGGPEKFMTRPRPGGPDAR